MKIEERIDYYLNENKQEEEKEAKKLLDYYIKEYKTMKKVKQAILSNVVNNQYTKRSNSFVLTVWDEFNKRFPS